jgi:Fe-S cluster assembly iron-binding protein IscA
MPKRQRIDRENPPEGVQQPKNSEDPGAMLGKERRLKPIIHITDRASKHLREVLTTRANSPNWCLRLVAAPAGAGLVLDRPRDEDKVVEIDGRPILHLHPILAPVLDGATLDYADSSDGPQLTLVK